MKLYGSVQCNKLVNKEWYLLLPEFWTPDKNYVKTHPYSSLTNVTWSGINMDLFDFYEIEIDFLDFSKVFDLRLKDWKSKLLMFLHMFGGIGWSPRGGLGSALSPLEHIMFMGNYNVFYSVGYQWIILNHKEAEGDPAAEIWVYTSIFDNPENIYKVTKVDPQEFIR